MQKVKTLLGVMAFVVVIAMFTGCPLPVDQPPASVEDQPMVVKMMLTLTEAGELLIEGSIFEDKVRAEERVLFEALLGEMKYLGFHFYKQDEHGNLEYFGYNPILVQEDGSVADTAGVFFDSSIQYVDLNAQDEKYKSLFISEVAPVSLIPGETTEVSMNLKFLKTYRYWVVIDNMRGNYDQLEFGGETQVSSVNGEEEAYWRINDDGEFWVEAFLSLDFESGILTVFDQDGYQYDAPLNFNIFDALEAEDGVIHISYPTA